MLSELVCRFRKSFSRWSTALFGAQFYPTIFDYTYDAAKGVAPDFLGMDEADADQARQGYFSMIAVRPIPQVNFVATFEDYTNTEPKLYLGITESGIAERTSFRAFYLKAEHRRARSRFSRERGEQRSGLFRGSRPA